MPTSVHLDVTTNLLVLMVPKALNLQDRQLPVRRREGDPLLPEHVLAPRLLHVVLAQIRRHQHSTFGRLLPTAEELDNTRQSPGAGSVGILQRPLRSLLDSPSHAIDSELDQFLRLLVVRMTWRRPCADRAQLRAGWGVVKHHWVHPILQLPAPALVLFVTQVPRPVADREELIHAVRSTKTMRSSPQRELHATAEDLEERSATTSKHLVHGCLRQLHLPALRSANDFLLAGAQRG